MRNLFIGVLILVLFVLAVVPVFAGGEGFWHNCPGPVITILSEEGGVDVACVLLIKHCSDVIKIWDNGTGYLQYQCDNGKPTPVFGRP